MSQIFGSSGEGLPPDQKARLQLKASVSEMKKRPSLVQDGYRQSFLLRATKYVKFTTPNAKRGLHRRITYKTWPGVTKTPIGSTPITLPETPDTLPPVVDYTNPLPSELVKTPTVTTIGYVKPPVVTQPFWSSSDKTRPVVGVDDYTDKIDTLSIQYNDFFEFNRVLFEYLPKPFTYRLLYRDVNGVVQNVLTTDLQPWMEDVALTASSGFKSFDTGIVPVFKTNQITLVCERPWVEDYDTEGLGVGDAYSADIRNFEATLDTTSLANIPDSDFYHKDVLGNLITTRLQEWEPKKALDGSTATFWKCSPQPVSEAVVNFFLDVRHREGYDLVSTLVDKIFIDPLYTGPQINLYTALDDGSIPDSTGVALDRRDIAIDKNVNFRTTFDSSLVSEINYVENPSFEVGLSSWVAVGLTAVQDSSICLDGKMSVKLDGTGTFSTTLYNIPSSYPLTVLVGVRGSGTFSMELGNVVSDSYVLDSAPLTNKQILENVSDPGFTIYALTLDESTSVRDVVLTLNSTGTLYVDRVIATTQDSSWLFPTVGPSDDGTVWEGSSQISRSATEQGLLVRRSSSDYISVPAPVASEVVDIYEPPDDGSFDLGTARSLSDPSGVVSLTEGDRLLIPSTGNLEFLVAFLTDFNSETSVCRTVLNIVGTNASLLLVYDGTVSTKGFKLYRVVDGTRRELCSLPLTFLSGAYLKIGFVQEAFTSGGDNYVHYSMFAYPHSDSGELELLRSDSETQYPIRSFSSLQIGHENKVNQLGGVFYNVTITQPKNEDGALFDFNEFVGLGTDFRSYQTVQLSGPSDTDDTFATLDFSSELNCKGGSLSPDVMNEKQWEPVYKDYVAKRGFLYFPEARLCDFIKLEFTNLIQEPYPLWNNSVESTVQVFPYEVELYYSQLKKTSPPSTLTSVPTLANTAGTTLTGSMSREDANNAANVAAKNVRLDASTGGFSDIGTLLSADSESTLYSDTQKYMGSQELITESSYTVTVPGYTTTRSNYNQIREYESKVGHSMGIEPSYWTVVVPDKTTTVTEKSTQIVPLETDVTAYYLSTKTHMRFVRTMSHHYRRVSVTRQTNYAYFAGLREVIPYRVKYTNRDNTASYRESFEDTIHIESSSFYIEHTTHKALALAAPSCLVMKTFPSTNNVLGVRLESACQSGREQLTDPLLQTGEDWTTSSGVQKLYDSLGYYFSVASSLGNYTKTDSYPVSAGSYVDFTFNLDSTFIGTTLEMYLGTSIIASQLFSTSGSGTFTLSQYIPYDGSVYVKFVFPDSTLGTFRIDSARLRVSTLIWEISCDGGKTYLKANEVLNRKDGVLGFSKPGSELKVKATGRSEGDWIQEFTLTPFYSG